jgi:hypothetical protein
LRRKYSTGLTRIIFIALLLGLAGQNIVSAQSVPALSFDIKKPAKLENKKLGSEEALTRNLPEHVDLYKTPLPNTIGIFNANEKLKEIIARAKDAIKMITLNSSPFTIIPQPKRSATVWNWILLFTKQTQQFFYTI